MSLVIIGSGLAGYSLAREFRKLQPDTPLTVITADQGEFYSKPMLSNALSKDKRADDLVTTDAAAMAKQLKATILTETQVSEIDAQQRYITTSHGEVKYGQLVLANGAIPIRPPMDGNGANKVLSVNNLDDYRAFRRELEAADSVAIIGPGLIGCEFATDLANNGKQVTVIGPDAYPISSLLPEAVGRAVETRLTENGITWNLGTVAERVEYNSDRFYLTLANGQQVTADLVLSAVGLRPDTRLAENSGLTINRGIVTDHFLRSSNPYIYALGDCAEVAGLSLPFVMPIMIGARALAKTLSGVDTPVTYPAMPVVIKTVNCPLVTSPPARGAEGKWEIIKTPTSVKALFRDSQGQLLGFALMGEAVTEKGALTKELPAVLA